MLLWGIFSKCPLLRFKGNVVLFEGVQTWADGAKYEGDFVNDLRHGDGKLHWANGEVCWLILIRISPFFFSF